MSLHSSLELSLTPETTGESLMDIIDGSVVPPDKLAIITVTAEDTGEALKEKRKN